MDYLQYVESLITLLRLEMCFKPYYKWITFNTYLTGYLIAFIMWVLNLIINGLPSILSKGVFTYPLSDVVLNLIINGLPSIPRNVQGVFSESVNDSFKPYYKWITFNTYHSLGMDEYYDRKEVLNLIINGLPSILHYSKSYSTNIK